MESRLLVVVYHSIQEELVDAFQQSGQQKKAG